MCPSKEEDSMKNLNSGRKPISLFVIVAFSAMLCFWAGQAPAAPFPGRDAGTAAAPDEGHGTDYIESEENPPAHGKKGKFPWLVAAVVIVAGGAALYFLVLKKKNYTLTVSVGEGVTGSPAAGTSTSKKGTVINYSYAKQAGYDNLAVTLDGAPVAASGTVTMNANHALEATAAKTFVLTVIRGDNVEGAPSSGSYARALGTNVAYSYAPASGYANLEVKLDNVLVPNSGTVAMGANHTLTALLRGANIAVDSTPAGARIFVDGADSGRTTPYTFTYSSAVTKTVLLQHSCGYKEYSQSVTVAVGATKTVSHVFAAGIQEDFEVPPSSCWLPYHASSWDHTGHGEYRYSGAASFWSTSVYNHSFTGDYTAIARMFPKSGADHHPLALILGTGTDMTDASGYVFYYYPSFASSGQYGIWRISNNNFINASGGSVVVIKSMTPSAAITEGLGKFNVLKVVKSGSQYSFYINNTLLHTFTDSTHVANYLALAAYCSTMPTVVEFEYVYLNPAS
jgi:hypothetical protein